MEKSKYIKHISGFKGMACVFIMLFHYLEIYKTSVDFLPRINILDKILNLTSISCLNCLGTSSEASFALAFVETWSIVSLVAFMVKFD